MDLRAARARLGPCVRPARITCSPGVLNTAPTTGTSTSRIDSPVWMTATLAPSAERVTSLSLSSARPAV